MKYKQLLIAAIFLIVMVACQNNNDKKASVEEKSQGNKATVLEVIDGKTYTYINLSENGKEFWAAIAKRETKVDEVLYYAGALEMKNFESKELGRTFDSILFISQVSNKPISQGGSEAPSGMMGKKKEGAKLDVTIEPAKGGVTVAEIYANLDSYKGKEIIVKGKVVKYNSMIMDRNWLHIQDGTADGDKFDLTITTNETLKVGDIATLKGTIAVEKDFGSGYFYDVIMESATVVK